MHAIRQVSSDDLMYEAARSALRCIPVNGHDLRFRIACALKSAFGEEGRVLWDTWRGERGSDKADSDWRSIDPTGEIGIGTLFHLAKENGWRGHRTDSNHIVPSPKRTITAEVFDRNEVLDDSGRERERTAEIAAKVLKAASPAQSSHPYLQRKCIPALSTLYEIAIDDLVCVTGYVPKSKEIELKGRVLAIPVNQEGQWSTLELIDEAGRKSALRGRGTKSGGFWATKELPADDETTETLLVGEGVATVITATVATEHIGIATLSSGNLRKVCEQLRGRYRNADIVVLADLERISGEPDSHALDAARTVSGRIAIPDFGSSRDHSQTDFNDLSRSVRIEVISQLINGAQPLSLDAGHGSKKSITLPADTDTPVSDDELTQRFTGRHKNDFRYVAALGRWLIWSGTHWAHDDSKAVFDAIRQSCRLDLGLALTGVTKESDRKRMRERLGGAATIAAVERLASADRVHAITNDALDADPWLLNTPTGAVDLRTGRFRPNDPRDLCTKVTAATPRGECPMFRLVLERVLPDQRERDYVQRLIGYTLTGTVKEHVVALAYGTGANGKSLIFSAIKYALGDYAITLGSEVLMESHNDRHPTEIAVLRGARMALCSEVDSGRRWNETRVKRLSGGDPITARLIARDPFEFQPSHKLVLLANAKPGIRVVDEAIRRRIHLIEFPVTIPEAERDASLPEKLKAEAGGILAWALEGCLDWQTDGLQPPDSIIAATSAYLDREDVIAEWISECCRPVGQVSLSDAHASYRDWAERNGHPVIGRNTFGDQLEAHGIPRIAIRARVWAFKGLSIVSHREKRHVG
jgi:P4 family phage/plasmid primase-like protien